MRNGARNIDKRRKRKYRIDKLKDECFEILCELAKDAVKGIGALARPRLFYKLAYNSFASEIEAEKDRVGQIIAEKRYLRALKQAKLIKEEKTAKGLMYALTRKGLESFLRHKIIKENRKLKDHYCLVIFDIPESQRRIRSDFRFFLKQANFFQVQKSVWATDKDVLDDLVGFVKMAKIEKWVNVCLVKPMIMNLYNKEAQE